MSRIAPQFPTTQNTPNSISVTTASGFNQGDLVYYNNGDYKSPSNISLPSSVNFNVPLQQGIMSGGLGGFGTPVFTAAQLQVANNFGASNMDAFAILTSGNIVQVFRSSSGYPSFQIVTPAGAIVAGPTNITTASFINTGLNVAVCALSGGGFAMSFVDNTLNPAYAVYTNTGTVTTAATVDALPSGFSSNLYAIGITALPNGGFVAAHNNGTSLYYKVYTSTGGTTKTWTVWTTLVNAYSPYSIAARSDSSFCLVGLTTSNQPTYAIYNAAGTAIVSPTTISVSTQFVDVCCLSDGTTFVIGISNTTVGITAYLLPTGNVLSSAKTLIPYANSYNSGHISTYFWGVKLVPQAAGGFAVITADASYASYVGFFNSSGGYLGVTNTNGNVPICNPAGSPVYQGQTFNAIGAGKIAAYELSGKIYFSFPVNQGNTFSANMTLFSIDETSYQFQLNSTATSLSSNSGSYFQQAPASLSLTNSTPTNFKYLASSTGANLTNIGISTLVTPTTIASFGVSSIHCTTLTNGNIVVVYVNTAVSTYPMYVNVYSPYGALITSFFVQNNNYNPAAYSYAKVFSLANGKFGIAWVSSANNIGFILYSASYNQTYSGSLIAGLSQLTTVNYNFDVAGSAISDRFLVHGSGTSNVYIYDNTCTLVQQISPVSNNISGPKVCADAIGGFYISGWSSGTTASYLAHIYPVTSTTYSSAVRTSFTSDASVNGTDTNQRVCFGNNGAVVFPYSNSSGGNYLSVGATSDWFSSATPFGYTTGVIAQNAANGSGLVSFGMTGMGSYVLLSTQTTGSTGSFRIIGSPPLFYGYTNSSIESSNNTFPTSCFATISASITGTPNFYITPAAGYSCFVSYKDANSYPTFAIFNTQPIPVTTNVTSGVTVSAATPVLPYVVASTTPVVSGAVLSGVANNTASAGSSASITTNGQATLNTNYSATTPAQAFDYQLPNGSGIQGVKGTISGRNVNLTGNN